MNKILKLLDLSSKFLLQYNSDALVINGDKYKYIIISAHEMKTIHYDLLNSSNLVAICDLLNPFCGLELNQELFVLQEKPASTIKICSCLENISLKSFWDNDNYALPSKFPKYYLDLLEQIEQFVFFDQLPEDNINFSFNIINSTDLNRENLNPIYYSKRYNLFKKNIKSENTKQLKELAELYIFLPKEKYTPQRNDIIKLENSFQLIRDTTVISSKLPKIISAIRPKQISPEYLCAYLNNPIITFAIASTFETVTMHRETMDSLPIILPNKNDNYYEELFSCISDNIPTDNLYNLYFKNINSKALENNFEEVINSELLDQIQKNKFSRVYQLLQNDIKELNICFNAKAYKAALIMAGSILEAFLIDWLSDIKKIDYFNENNRYRVQKTNKEGLPIYDKHGKPIMKDADLIDYISEIKVLKAPDWEDAYTQATEIRKKRNNVHAKVCINKNDVNEKTCKQIIQYLEYVINTRRDMEIYQ